MIAKLAGLLDQVMSDGAVIDVGGVGYLVFCSTRTIGHLPAPGGTVMDTISTSRVGSFSKGVVKYRMVWRAGVVAWDHAAGANMQVIASTSAMINFCISSSPELVHTRYTT